MRLITGDECGLLKECIPELSTNPEEEEERNQAVSVPSRRRVLVSKDKGVALLNQDHLVPQQNSASNTGCGGLRRRGVVDLTWMSTSSAAHNDDSQFASLHMDGTVQLWRSRDYDDDDNDESSNNNKSNPFRFARYRRVSEISNIFGEKSAETDTSEASESTMMDPLSRPIGLYAFDSKSNSSSSNTARLVACNAQGSVCILNPHSSSSDDQIVRTFETVKGNQNMTATPTTKNIARLEYPNITSTALDGNILSAADSTSSSSLSTTRIALGGRDRDVMIWDLETANQVFKAKNLPPDPVTLLQPLVWPTAMCFMHNSTAFDVSPHILAVGTAYSQVRIYDVRVQQAVATAAMQKAGAPRKQRPLAYSPIKNVPHLPLEHRVTALCPMDSNHLIVGDAAGYLQSMDLRLLEKNTSRTAKKGEQSHSSSLHGPPQPSCVVGRFVGPGGSVRGLAQHADGNTLAAVGLDRMLRVYDTHTRKQVYCMYLKQRLNCVLFGRQEAKKKRYNSSSKSSIDNNDDGENDDEGRVAYGEYDSEDMDADDVVEDYVDSSDEEEAGNPRNQNDDDNVAESRKHTNEDGEGGSSSSSEDDDDESEDESSDSSEDDDDDEAPRKRRRR